GALDADTDSVDDPFGDAVGQNVRD
ncbi:MAG: hypothetical protein J07HB67_02251, partial [halophilic archaeon J07HB67]